MNAWVGVLNDFAEPWWRYILHVTWQGSLVGMLVLLAVWVGRRWPSPIRHALLLVALLKFTLPPTWTAHAGLMQWMEWQAPSFAAQPAVPEAMGPSPASAPGTLVSAFRMSGGFQPGDGMAPAPAWGPSPTVPAGLSVRASWMLLHAAGAAVVLVWVMLSVLRLGAIRRRGWEIEDGPLTQELRRLSEQLRLRRPVSLRVTPMPISPMAFGLRRRTVLLPASIEELHPAEQRTILAHELVHHRRGDLWVNGLQVLLAVGFWFNPILWLLNRELRRAREECCDDALLHQRLTTRDDYCETLMRAAGRFSSLSTFGGVLGFAPRRLHPLGRRIARIMDPRRIPATRLSRTGWALILCTAALLWPGARIDAEEDPAVAGKSLEAGTSPHPSPLVLDRGSIQMQELEKNRIDARVDMTVARARLDKVLAMEPDELVNAIDYVLVGNPLRPLRERLLDLDLEFARATQEHGADHPEVQRLVAGRNLLQARISDAVRGVQNGLRAEYEVAKERYDGLQFIVEEIRSSWDEAGTPEGAEQASATGPDGGATRPSSAPRPDDGESMMQKLVRDRIKAEVDMVVRKARLDQVMAMEEDELVHANPWVTRDSHLMNLRQSLVTSEVSLAMALEELGQNHPDVKRLTTGRDELLEALLDSAQGLKQGLRVDYEVARRKFEELDRVLREVRAEQRGP